MSEARRHRAKDSPPNRTTAHVPAPRRSGDAPTAPIVRALPQHRRSPMASRVLAVLGLLVLLSLILVAVFDWRLSSTFT